VLIQSLHSERLVSFNDDCELELTEYAKSKFSESSDEYPRFFKIENKIDNVSFNLVSFTPVDPAKPRSNALSIDLKEKDEHISKSKYFAEKSFENHFYKISKGKLSDLPELYKISNVTTKSRYSAALPLDFYLKIDEDCVDIYNSQSTEELIKSDDEIYKAIIETLSSRNDLSLVFNEQTRFFLDYIKLFKDRVISNKLSSRNTLDFLSYLQDVHIYKTSCYGAKTQALIGNIYSKDRKIESNFHTILSKLSQFKKHSMSICWLVPEHTLYGRTSVFSEFIKSIKSIGGGNEIKLLAPIEDQQQYTVFSNSFNTYGYTDPVLNGQLEILLYAPYFVCVIFHYYYPSNFSSIPIPVGFLSEDQGLVEIARKLVFEHLHSNKRYQGKLGKNRNNGNSFKDDFNFLDISPVQEPS
jgi:hypothetical protein